VRGVVRAGLSPRERRGSGSILAVNASRYDGWEYLVMSISLALATYFICWWVVLFAILPLKIGPQPAENERDPFADASGAPHAPNLARKFVITTIVSAIIFAAIYAIIALHLVSLDGLPF
jgi:predicted secreted protein